MVAGIVLAVAPIEARPAREIDLAADDRLDSLGAAGIVEGDGSVHDAVIGDGAGGMSALFGAPWNIGDAAGAVEQTVFTVQMQMHEIGHHTAPFIN